MNAPWKPAGASLRDPFHAYVCDDNSYDIVRSIAIELGFAPEKVNKDAHGSWMVKIKVKDPSETNALMSAADYEKFVSEEAGH